MTSCVPWHVSRMANERSVSAIRDASATGRFTALHSEGRNQHDASNWSSVVLVQPYHPRALQCFNHKLKKVVSQSNNREFSVLSRPGREQSFDRQSQQC